MSVRRDRADRLDVGCARGAAARSLSALAALAALAAPWSPDAVMAGESQTVTVNIAAWQAAGFYGLSANSSATAQVPPGSTVTAVAWIEASFTCLSGSWQSDVVLSVNDSRGSVLYWDHRVSPVNNSSAYLGSGVFANPGLYGSGPFVDADGLLFVTVYDTYEDNGIDEADEVFTGGTLVISYAPPALPACLADVASDATDTSRTPNGAVGPEDLDAFIGGFIAENTAIADVASDTTDATFNPNGAVGAEDLDAFINAFIAGC